MHYAIKTFLLKDYQVLMILIQWLNYYATSTILDVGAAGTTMRFLTALKASQEGTCILTGF